MTSELHFTITNIQKKKTESVPSRTQLSSVNLLCWVLGGGVGFPVAFRSWRCWKLNEVKMFALVHVGEGRWAHVEPLYEMDLSLVLEALIGLPFLVKAMYQPSYSTWHSVAPCNCSPGLSLWKCSPCWGPWAVWEEKVDRSLVKWSHSFINTQKTMINHLNYLCTYFKCWFKKSWYG